ncbi:MAG: hypothetical protein FH751_10050 [Firmicutes bacterium]|nr:hypothetical protein [Bacillota bacterium]
MEVKVIILFFILFLIGLFIIGLFKFKSNKKTAMILIYIPTLIFIVSIGLFLMLSHQTTVDSIQLEVEGENGKYTLKGKWLEKYDYYSYGTDILVFYAPDNQKIPVVVKEDMKNQIQKGILSHAKDMLKGSKNYIIGLEP